MNIFVVSDCWFNRMPDNSSCNDIADYNNNIIDNWNIYIGKTDIVYVLGGFGISDLYSKIRRLNGEIHFLNNYYTEDEKKYIETLKYQIENSIYTELSKRVIFEENQIISLPDEDCILSYFPLSDWKGKESGTYLFHGMNDYTNLQEHNVSCDARSRCFKPVSISKVKKLLNSFN